MSQVLNASSNQATSVLKLQRLSYLTDCVVQIASARNCTKLTIREDEASMLELQVARDAKLDAEHQASINLQKADKLGMMLHKTHHERERYRRIVEQHLTGYMSQLDQIVSELENGESQMCIDRSDMSRSDGSPGVELGRSEDYSGDDHEAKQPKLYAFARSLAQRVQNVINKTMKDSAQLAVKLRQLSREDTRQRALQAELRRSLNQSRETQKTLQAQLDSYVESLNEARSIETHLRHEIKCQQTRLKALLSEKHKLLDALEETDHLRRLTGQQLERLNQKLIDNGLQNLLQNRTVVADPSSPTVLCTHTVFVLKSFVQDTVKNLTEFALNLINHARACVEQLHDHPTAAHCMLVHITAMQPDISPASLELARNKAAALLGLTLDELDRLCEVRSYSRNTSRLCLWATGTQNAHGRQYVTSLEFALDSLGDSVKRWVTMAERSLDEGAGRTEAAMHSKPIEVMLTFFTSPLSKVSNGFEFNMEYLQFSHLAFFTVHAAIHGDSMVPINVPVQESRILITN
ncbi:unnamed protein product [Echinostoma caproni]|uniref:Coiled-coil domain-containing protein 128 n=1 Tax=Echinostoma caproni TaxID=27848 RepID=A0A183A5R0_9TREM|nr:unnamed protein product [Echinostoma caproni]